jgi:hypothetical protein
MVAEHRYEPEFMREVMDYLESLTGTIPPVDNVSQIDKDIDLSELLSELLGAEAGCTCADCCRISMYIRKDNYTHVAGRILELLCHIN